MGAQKPPPPTLITVVEIITGSFLRDGVGTEAAPRMTAAQPAHRQPTPASGAVAAQGNGGVLRTAGDIAARGRSSPPSRLVQANESDQDAGGCRRRRWNSRPTGRR